VWHPLPLSYSTSVSAQPSLSLSQNKDKVGACLSMTKSLFFEAVSEINNSLS
jgi:hypothetical protein